jgi:uncharacterized protein (TIGR03067 family)
MCRVLLVLAVLSLGLAPAPLPRPDKSKEDLKRLQGEWHRVRVTVGGNFYLEKPHETTIVVAGDRMKYALAGRPTNEWAFTLDATRGPPRFDRKGVKGDANGLIFRGIYRLDGDTFILCSREGDRPVDFRGAAPSVYVEAFQRKKR